MKFEAVQDAARSAGAIVLRPFDRLAAQLCGEKTADLAAARILATYTVIWTLYDVVARASQDIHYDMGEMVGWSRELALGGSKHPELGGWIAGLWFWFFPEHDWSFYLLSNILAAIALWTAWKLSEGWLDCSKRAAGLAALMLMPFFNFFAWKYNANSILMPLWAITTFWFFRSVETRAFGAAALAGLAAAAAMMGKYWTVFLLAGLGASVFFRPDWRVYFRSSAPKVTFAVGFLALSPHLYWLAENHFPSLHYSLSSHAAVSLAKFAESLAIYLIGVPGYAALPLLAIWLVARPDFAAVKDTLWPPRGPRRFAAVAYWVPIILPLFVALALYVDMSALWLMSGCTLLPIVLLSSPKLRISERDAAFMLGLVLLLSLLAMLFAPLRALRIHAHGATNFGAHYQLVAKAVEQEWQVAARGPLRIVGSYGNLVYGSSFYFADHPSMLNIVDRRDTPHITDERIEEEGAALVCPIKKKACIDAANEMTKGFPEAYRVERTLTRYFWGEAGKPKQFLIVVIPPLDKD